MLHGLQAPDSDGVVLEMHIDSREISPDFVTWLRSKGFENDPFDEFYPPHYDGHMTGRTRISRKQLAARLRDADALATEIVTKASGFDLFVEVELVLETIHFSGRDSQSFHLVLDELSFRRTGQFGGAEADVHAEWRKGTVPAHVRTYLLSKGFYWVSTPPTRLFPAEEIATLQTTTVAGGRAVFDLLVAHPLPGCTGIHLEHKPRRRGMRATRPDLPMPEAIEVSGF